MSSTATVDERYSGRTLASQPNKYATEYTYVIRGATNEVDAYNALHASAPTSLYANLVTRTNIRVEEVDTVSGTYDGIVTYDIPDSKPRETGETVLSFDSGGGTQHISSSKTGVPIQKYGTSTATVVPATYGAIGDTSDGVAGVDIALAVFQFSVTKYFPATNVTATFISNLYSITGKTNDAPVGATVDGVTMAFDTAQVLFLGAQGSKRGVGDFEITEKFAVGENRTDLVVGSITNITKLAWDYLWVKYEKTASPGTSSMVFQTPKYVYVDRVYDSGDFTKTGL